MGTEIDVTTAGPDGHWDYSDIVRLCAYRDQLRAENKALQAIDREFHNIDDVAEIRNLHRDLAIQAVNATAVLEAQHERDYWKDKCGLIYEALTGQHRVHLTRLTDDVSPTQTEKNDGT
jgi:DNA-binding MltR family transcriptional regulator